MDNDLKRRLDNLKKDLKTISDNISDVKATIESLEKEIERKNCVYPKPAYVPASPEVEARVDAAVEAGRINDKRDAEREACAKVCIEMGTEPMEWQPSTLAVRPDHFAVAQAIRAHLIGNAK